MDNLEKNIILLKSVPDSPGVYILKDETGKIFYVGKAKSLRKRLSSYFKKSNDGSKSIFLGQRTDNFEFIATGNELEALILEETLIKKHRPKFNVRMKDDKSYPFIVVTNEEYPRLIYTRNPDRRNTRIFGPYADSKAARSVVEVANNIFRLRRCRKQIPLKEGERPCLNYQIGKCSGPCVGKISQEEYRSLIEGAINFISGETAPVIASLTERMKKHAANQQFEKAAQLRDIIFDIQTAGEKQVMTSASVYDKDCIAAAIFGNEGMLLLFEFRSGTLSGRKIFIYENTDLSDPGEIIEHFIYQHYSPITQLPHSIIIKEKIPSLELMKDFFAGKNAKVSISTPHSDEDRSIASLMQKNIDMLKTERESRAALNNATEALFELQRELSLDAFPEYIVCFDISNFQGKDSVASMSAFRNGYPEKNSYRKFKIRAYDSANDPAMIHEAVSRFLQNVMNENLEMPDLIMIDGGPTQLQRAQDAAETLGVTVPIYSIAKKHEEIFFASDKEPIRIPHERGALKLIQRIRDEAHRFGVTYHRKLRSKRIISSSLDSITGIGEKRRNQLLEKFGSVQKIAQCTPEELSEKGGITIELAERILRSLVSDLDSENDAG